MGADDLKQAGRHCDKSWRSSTACISRQRDRVAYESRCNNDLVLQEVRVLVFAAGFSGSCHEVEVVLQSRLSLLHEIQLLSTANPTT